MTALTIVGTRRKVIKMGPLGHGLAEEAYLGARTRVTAQNHRASESMVACSMLLVGTDVA